MRIYEVLCMGTKIKTITDFYIGNMIFNVELNEGTKAEAYEVHIQNDLLKLCFKEADFTMFAACIIAAQKRFNVLKGLE